jgi:hypothetical protein
VDGRRYRPLVALLAALVGVGLPWGTARAEIFEIGPVDGILDLTFAYGLMARTQERDPDFIGIANGGNAPSVNFDDGTLNYDKGILSNELRLSGDLTLAWRNFGAFIRGFAFYDFETELYDREWSELSDDAHDLVGAGGKLQEYYLSAHFTPWGMPIQVRVGNQVINWGEGSFLRFGVDVINPIDFVSLLRPTTSVRDVFVPHGMVWAASNVTELIAIEGFYQYEWEPAIDPPVGYFFSADDLIGGDGTNKYVTGDGLFSDLGTDLDEEFGLPPGTLGFDETFMRVPSAGREKPNAQGQFGVTAQILLPALGSANLGVHFINYHSRLPLISGIAADQAAIDAAVAIGSGSPTEDEKTLALGTLSNETHYLVTYPEDIKMLGLSFDGVLPYTGTLIGIEASHHFNWPVQILSDAVIETALSPIRNALEDGDPGPIGANQIVSGIDETHKTQLALTLAQAFGPRLWSSQSLLVFDVGWVHFDGLSGDVIEDEDSWGYSISGFLTYDGVFGAVSLEPFVAFTHDVSGVTPGPAGAFLEDRKSLSVGVSLNYTNTITANITYVSFFGGKPLNAGVDRDFVSFNVRYHY